MKTRNIAVMATATLALAFSTGPAFANPGEVQTKSIAFADLDLNSPQGQERLERRIEAAARSVCSAHESHLGTRLRSSQHNACIANARAQAKKQIASAVSNQRRGG
ncbi:MAG: UrcA family protein [Erythrobacter sp.]|uniref:UrcA family protein n=1 Tax=Erythrobacter sp. TaxID=1042 RepID=UPI0032671B51